jgi:hypothetical protein
MGKIDEQEERERNKERERAKRRGVKVGAKPSMSTAPVVKEDDHAAAAAAADHMRSVSFDPHSLYSPYSRDDLHSPAADTDEDEKEEETRMREKGRRTLMRGVYGGQSTASLTGDGESATQVLMEGDEEGEDERKDESEFHRQQTGATDVGAAESAVKHQRAVSLTPSTVHLPLSPSAQAALSTPQTQRQLDEPAVNAVPIKPSKRRHSLHANGPKISDGKSKATEPQTATDSAAGVDQPLRPRNQFRRHSLPPRKSDEDIRVSAAAAAAADDEKDNAAAKRQPMLGQSSRTREGSRPQPIVFFALVFFFLVILEPQFIVVFLVLVQLVFITVQQQQLVILLFFFFFFFFVSCFSQCIFVFIILSVQLFFLLIVLFHSFVLVLLFLLHPFHIIPHLLITLLHVHLLPHLVLLLILLLFLVHQLQRPIPTDLR